MNKLDVRQGFTVEIAISHFKMAINLELPKKILVTPFSENKIYVVLWVKNKAERVMQTNRLTL